MSHGPRVLEVRARSTQKLAQAVSHHVEALRRDTPSGPVLVVHGEGGASVWAEADEPPSPRLVRRENLR